MLFSKGKTAEHYYHAQSCNMQSDLDYCDTLPRTHTVTIDGTQSKELVCFSLGGFSALFQLDQNILSYFGASESTTVLLC